MPRSGSPAWNGCGGRSPSGKRSPAGHSRKGLLTMNPISWLHTGQNRDHLDYLSSRSLTRWIAGYPTRGDGHRERCRAKPRARSACRARDGARQRPSRGQAGPLVASHRRRFRVTRGRLPTERAHSTSTSQEILVVGNDVAGGTQRAAGETLRPDTEVVSHVTNVRARGPVEAGLTLLAVAIAQQVGIAGRDRGDEGHGVFL
jgi:hypothetical protein